MSHSNNLTWYCRQAADKTYWEWSFTHFDADLQVISTDNSTAQPVPKYFQNPGGQDTNYILENLIWSISSNRDQSILMLHQMIQGTLFIIEDVIKNVL